LLGIFAENIALDFIRNNDACLFSDYGTFIRQATNFQSSILMCSGKSLPKFADISAMYRYR